MVGKIWCILLRASYVYIYIYIYRRCFISFMRLKRAVNFSFFLSFFLWITPSLSLYLSLFVPVSLPLFSLSLSFSVYIYWMFSPFLPLKKILSFFFCSTSSLTVTLFLSVSLFLSFFPSLFLSLSLSIYIYIYIYITVSITFFSCGLKLFLIECRQIVSCIANQLVERACR